MYDFPFLTAINMYICNEPSRHPIILTWDQYDATDSCYPVWKICMSPSYFHSLYFRHDCRQFESGVNPETTV